MKDRLEECLQQIQQHGSQVDAKLQTLRRECEQQLQQQLDKALGVHQSQYLKNRNDLAKQEHALKYYLDNLPTKDNLFPLLTQVTDKLSHNSQLIDKFAFTATMQADRLQEQLHLHELQIKEISTFFLNSQKLRQYCKTEVETLQQMLEKYRKIGSVPVSCSPTVKYCFDDHRLKAPIQQALIQLRKCKNYHTLELSMTTQGTMTLKEYQQLVEVLQMNQVTLRKLVLRLMDMEFNQNKCDLLKKGLQGIEGCKELTIRNYYRENKLGMFQDFSWQPFRKDIHIFSGIWN